MKYENNLDFALVQDERDILRAYRTQYLFPKHENRDMLYFTGNSLGLQPVGVREALIQECDDWAKYGVEGHFLAKHPWYSYHEDLAEPSARIVGALIHEVVVMNQLTVNLNLLLISFYQPQGKRRKILFETKPFPSDQYAFASHAKLHGLNPDDVLVEMQPRNGEVTLRNEDILAKIEELGDELALVCFGAVNYFTGQFFDLKSITEKAHQVGALAGFDLAHAAGNVPLRLHDWEVDFACWCTYKYLNSGPGSVGGVYIHDSHVRNKELLRLAGWWGNNKKTRFEMKPDFDPMITAEAWSMSNAPVFSMAVHRAALVLFAEVGMYELRNKSVQLTGYLEFILAEVQKETGQKMQILTPKEADSRGCQLSIVVEGSDKSLVAELFRQGVIVDWREPNVIRMAPVPMYNSYEDVYQFGVKFTQILKKRIGKS